MEIAEGFGNCILSLKNWLIDAPKQNEILNEINKNIQEYRIKIFTYVELKIKFFIEKNKKENKEVKRTISDGEILKSSNTGTVKKTTTKKVASKTKNEDSDKNLKDAKAINGEVKKTTKKATSKTTTKTVASNSEMIKSKSTTTKKVEGDTPSKVTKKTTSKVTSKK